MDRNVQIEIPLARVTFFKKPTYVVQVGISLTKTELHQNQWTGKHPSRPKFVYDEYLNLNRYVALKVWNHRNETKNRYETGN